MPGGAAAVEGEGHGAQGAALLAGMGGGERERRDLGGGVEPSDVAAAGGAVDAVGDGVGAPVGAVVPGAVVPLHHDLAGEVRSEERRVGKERSSRGYAGAGNGTAKIGLGHIGQ